MLSMVIIISTIIFLVTTTGVLISTIQSGSAYNERLASEALFAARAGAQDAIIKIVRDKNYPVPDSYSIGISAGRTADVEITAATGGFDIISIGTAGGRRTAIRVELGVDAVTGEVTVNSFKEDYSL